MSGNHFTVDHVRITTDKPFGDVTAAFERQLGRFEPGVYQALAADGDAEGARARIEAMAGPSGFMLFGTQDHGSLLRLAGQKRKAIQYVVGNPLFALQMTQHDIRASLYAPLRVLIYEDGRGKTCMEYDRPSSVFGQFGNDRISPTAAMLDRKLEALVAAAFEGPREGNVMQASTTVADAQRDDDALTVADLISAYENGVEELRLAVAGMTGGQLRSRPIAGKWSTLEVVCHTADCEQFFADRLKRTVAMDRPLLLGADGFRYPEPLRYQDHDLGEELDLVAVTRRQTARTLRLVAPGAWRRTAVHSETGLVALRQLLLHAVNPLRHHLRFVAEKRAALGA